MRHHDRARAHDDRDYDFAKKYQLPIRVVVRPTATGDRDETVVEPALSRSSTEERCSRSTPGQFEAGSAAEQA